MSISYPRRDPELRQDPHPVSYEPRRVGNDLGLWVMGSGWVDLVEEAVGLLEQRLAQHPADLQAQILMGLAHLTLGNAPQAHIHFASALAQDPKNLEALLGLGAAQVVSGDDDAALATYRKALEVDRRNRTAKDALRWLTTPLPRKDEK